MRERKAVTAEVRAEKGLIRPEVKLNPTRLLPFWRYRMGDDGMHFLCFTEKHLLTIGRTRIDEVQKLFPEAQIRVMGKLVAQGKTESLVTYTTYADWLAKHPDY